MACFTNKSSAEGKYAKRLRFGAKATNCPQSVENKACGEGHKKPKWKRRGIRDEKKNNTSKMQKR